MTTEIITDRAHVFVYTDVFNKRVRIDSYAGDKPAILEIINNQILTGVEKLIIKSKSEDVPFFLAQGFVNEAYIQGYFSGADMFFMAKYFSGERQQSKKWLEEQAIMEELSSLKKSGVLSGEEIKVATVNEAARLAHLYRTIFKIYPTPLGDEAHVVKTMQDSTVYAYVEEDHQIVSAASAEVNLSFRNAELTDCATLPQAEGRGYMKMLLSFLENKLRSEGIGCCYSLARAESFSMNKAFAQVGYTYGGRLINNCFIYSGLEDMNVWYKSVPS